MIGIYHEAYDTLLIHTISANFIHEIVIIFYTCLIYEITPYLWFSMTVTRDVCLTGEQQMN